MIGHAVWDILSKPITRRRRSGRADIGVIVAIGNKIDVNIIRRQLHLRFVFRRSRDELAGRHVDHALGRAQGVDLSQVSRNVCSQFSGLMELHPGQLKLSFGKENEAILQECLAPAFVHIAAKEPDHGMGSHGLFRGNAINHLAYLGKLADGMLLAAHTGHGHGLRFALIRAQARGRHGQFHHRGGRHFTRQNTLHIFYQFHRGLIAFVGALGHHLGNDVGCALAEFGVVVLGPRQGIADVLLQNIRRRRRVKGRLADGGPIEGGTEGINIRPGIHVNNAACLFRGNIVWRADGRAAPAAVLGLLLDPGQTQIA